MILLHTLWLLEIQPSNKKETQRMLKFIMDIYDKIIYAIYFIKLGNKIIKIEKTKLRKNKIRISPENYLFFKNLELKNSIINIEGIDNKIYASGRGVGTKITIIGNNNSINIKSYTLTHNLTIVLKGNNCHILIDEYTRIGNGGWIVCMGKNNYIRIGKDCMIADNVNIWATDSHPIYNIDNLETPINQSRPIIIENHVWLGKNSTITKGVKIEKNSIVGYNSVVTKNIKKGSIHAGNPAKFIKDNVTWDRKHITI